MVHTALEAAETLSREGIEAEIVDLRTISPRPRSHTETVRKTSKVILLHEHTRTGGLAGEIAAMINEEAFEHLDGPIVRIAAQDSPVLFSPPQEILPAPGERRAAGSPLAESVLALAETKYAGCRAERKPGQTNGPRCTRSLSPRV